MHTIVSLDSVRFYDRCFGRHVWRVHRMYVLCAVYVTFYCARVCDESRCSKPPQKQNHEKYEPKSFGSRGLSLWAFTAAASCGCNLSLHSEFRDWESLAQFLGHESRNDRPLLMQAVLQVTQCPIEKRKDNGAEARPHATIYCRH